jgi:hypothetical protein
MELEGALRRAKLNEEAWFVVNDHDVPNLLASTRLRIGRNRRFACAAARVRIV